jgi:hypothetical protein
MSTTLFPTVNTEAFERTLSEIKNGVAAAIQTHSAATESAVKSAKDFAAFHHGTVEAVLQAGQILLAGAQDLLRQAAESGQSAYGETVAGARAVAQARTARTLLDAQSGLVRATFERGVAEGSRFARDGFDLAEKIAAPVLARVVLAAETFAQKA